MAKKGGLSKIKVGGYKLCTPVYMYLVLCVVSFLMMLGMNVTGLNIIYFILKVVIWSFILSLLCQYGLSNVAWFLVLLPFILIFIYLVFFTTGMAMEAGKQMQQSDSIDEVIVVTA
jgi:hypothetical protein